MKKIIILTAIFLIGINTESIVARNKYKPLKEQEGVNFYYKWRPAKLFKKDSNYILVLKIENTNDNAVNINFKLDYYWQSILQASSPELQFCINARHKKRGKLQKLGFDTSDFSMDQINSGQFILELADIKIEKSEKCIKSKAKNISN